MSHLTHRALLSLSTLLTAGSICPAAFSQEKACAADPFANNHGETCLPSSLPVDGVILLTIDGKDATVNAKGIPATGQYALCKDDASECILLEINDNGELRSHKINSCETSKTEDLCYTKRDQPNEVLLLGDNAYKTQYLKSGEHIFILERLSDTNANPGTNGDDDDDSNASDSPRACSDKDFSVPESHLDEVKKECQQNKELCIAPSGQVIHAPELREGRSLNVVMYRPQGTHHAYELDVEFKRSQLMTLEHLAPDSLKSGQIWRRGPTQRVKLGSAGKLTVTAKVIVLGTTAKEQIIATSDKCTQSSNREAKITFDVTGHYHFMVGLMPTYTGLFDRRFTLNRSDDGVQRVFAQDVQEIDLAVTLTAYPFGVSPDQFIAYGLLLGTGLRSLGKTWYGGIELSSPIGFGLAGGVALVQVPALDADFLPGQPLADTQVPTHNTIEPTWFVGVNVQAELFRKAFQGLAGDDE